MSFIQLKKVKKTYSLFSLTGVYAAKFNYNIIYYKLYILKMSTKHTSNI